jgi:hypothetical protein
MSQDAEEATDQCDTLLSEATGADARRSVAAAGGHEVLADMPRRASAAC